MKITEFSKNNISEIRDLINNKLAELETLGLYANVGNIKYCSDSIETKLMVTVDGAKNEFEREFERSHSYHGIPAATLHKKFRLGDTNYTVVGIKSRARKRVMVTKDDSGTLYRMDADTVLQAIK